MNSIYTAFIQDVFSNVYRLVNGGTMTEYAEGGLHNAGGTYEYAVLRGERAEVFLSIINNNIKSLDVGELMFKPEYTKISVILYSNMQINQVKYSHCCYPKNLQRWLNGTLSRKKRCRIEFVALAVCWAAGWSLDMKNETDYMECRTALVKICEKYMGATFAQLHSINELFDMLWRTCEHVYQKSL